MMEGDSILSMIAGFLPRSPDRSCPPPTINGRPSTASAVAAAALAACDDAMPIQQVVHMICFSKDRAFQLDQLLGSAKLHLRLEQEKDWEGCAVQIVRLRVSVLYLVTAGTAAAAAPPQAAVAAVSPGAATGPLSSRREEGSIGTMGESYDLVRRKHPDVEFFRERPGEFCDQVRSLVSGELEAGVKEREGGESFVLFAVDDMFFYRDFELAGALRSLARDPSMFCVHLRLHPGITWSHTSGSPCSVPPLSPTVGQAVQAVPPQKVINPSGGDGGGSSANAATAGSNHSCKGGGLGGSQEVLSANEQVGASGSENAPWRRLTPRVVAPAEFGLLTFARGDGIGEWDYPWDLTGGIYRRKDAMAVVDGIVSTYGTEAAANPNLLEFHGHALLQQQALPRRSWTATTATKSANAASRSDTGGTGLAPAASPSPPSCVAPLGGNHSGSVHAGHHRHGDPEISSLPARTAEVISPVAASFNASDAAVSAAVNAVNAAPRCGCSGRAVVSSLAVNRVQSTYSTPVYASLEGGILDLDRRLWACPRHPLRSMSVTHDATDATADRRSAVSEAAVAAAAAAEVAGAERREVQQDWKAGGRDAVAREEGDQRDAEQVGGGFDGQAYRRRVFNSVHVGGLWFGEKGDWEEVTAKGGSRSSSKRGGCTGQQHDHPDTVTVLLPVNNGGNHLLDAVESVVACAREMPHGWHVELLIIDDGSVDGAVERAVEAVMANAGATAVYGRGVGLDGDEPYTEGLQRAGGGIEGQWGVEGRSIADGGGVGRSDGDGAAVDGGRGGDGFDAAGVLACGGSKSSGVAVRVLRHDRTLGLAKSLNEGLRQAKSELVARIDADDVCLPGRLKEQVAFMLENPDVSVLGSSVATFSGDAIRVRGESTNPRQRQDREAVTLHLPASGVQRVARHPTDPAFLAWSMLFSCCIAHPSVMLRRDRVIEAGGYDPAAEPAEDYDLWLRMEAFAPGCVTNLGEVFVGLRKHEGNVSRTRRQEQVKAADVVAARAMTRLLKGRGRPGAPGRDVTSVQAAAVRRPESVASAGELAEAARLLGDLGEAAVEATTVTRGEAVSCAAGMGDLPSKVPPGSPANESSRIGRSRHDGDDDRDGDDRRRRDEKMIARDVEGRLGAMAVHAIGRFGANAAPVLEEWRRRFPDRPFLFALGGGGR